MNSPHTMRILFDQGTPVPLRGALSSHTVVTAFELSWHNLANGELLQTAEADGFEVIVTTDQRLSINRISRNAR